MEIAEVWRAGGWAPPASWRTGRMQEKVFGSGSQVSLAAST